LPPTWKERFEIVAASTVLVRVMAPDGGDSGATLRALAMGNSIGMVLAGAGLLFATHRLTGGEGTGGTLRTIAIAGAGAIAGGLLGRLVVDATLDLAGSGLIGSILAAIPGALVALGVTLAAVYLLDRATLGPLLARIGVKS